ncbi:hypothetical protein DY000_02020508 [Brassica cretica]|uniref:DUF4283 domain-containing protein n=1 Tax=Brassica cretica TaxID=69181 RepID=A0ABQ7E8P1_BRACR|nr:hypothetical protein DY000_02020508 [Brassica cretica]
MEAIRRFRSHGFVGVGDPAAQNPWKSLVVGSSRPVFEVSNGVAAIDIPEDIYTSSDPLWKNYVVGYFIGDAPHVGSIHAIVNRIWTSPGVKVSESDEGAGIAFHGQNVSPVGTLLAELEALPASDLQNDVGSLEAVTGTKVVMQENEEWQGVSHRSQPSLDVPEVTKVSFDVNSFSQEPAAVTVSPSRFQVLEDLVEDEEDDCIEEDEMVEVVEVAEVRANEGKNGSQAAVSSTRSSVKSGRGGKVARKPFRTTKELKLQTMYGHSKSSSFQKA